MRCATWARRLAAVLLLGASLARAEDVLRPEIVKPLQAAQQSIQAGDYGSALASLRAADAVADRTPYENYLLERLRASAAVGAGETAVAMRASEALLASGRLPDAEQLPILQSLASAAYAAKDYAQALVWAERYFHQGGAGEPMLRRVAASYANLGDDGGYTATLEKLLVHHPKKAYWADRLARLAAQPGFANRLQLDLYRLKRATGTLQEAAEFVLMAQLALQSGLPGEARQVIEAGYAAGRLGSGPDATRHQRLLDLAARQANEDAKTLRAAVTVGTAEGLVASGQALVSVGQVDRGIELIEQGLAKGGLKRPDEARLHLGQAYLQGARKAMAVETFKAIRAADGLGDLARLWALHGALLESAQRE